MKNETLVFLRNLPNQKEIQFNRAFELYRKSAGHNTRIVLQMNSLGFSPARLETLLYELQKLHGITARELARAKEPIVDQIPVVGAEQVGGSEQNGNMEPAAEDPEGNKAAQETPSGNSANIFESATDDVKSEVKLRDEFPFLNDPELPNDLKVLIADKLTHYHAFVAAHKSLLATVPEEGEEPRQFSDDEIFSLAKKAVENFTANQDIYDELVCYKNTGKVLGKHPIFARQQKLEKLNNLSLPQIALRMSNNVNYINRATAEIKELTDAEKISAKQAKIEGWKEEQEILKGILKARGQ